MPELTGQVTYTSGTIVPASATVTIAEPPATPTLFGVNPPSPAYSSGSLAAELDAPDQRPGDTGPPA
jgi:hypothetical protein